MTKAKDLGNDDLKTQAQLTYDKEHWTPESIRFLRDCWQEMEKRGILPSSFMALDPPNPGAPNVWDDVTRMRTLNSEQARKGWEMHVCPLQLDIVERLSNDIRTRENWSLTRSAESARSPTVP